MSWSPRAVAPVAAFVVLDVVVVGVGLALSHRAPDSSTSPSTESGTSSSSVTDTAPIRGPLALAASAGGALVRVTRGSCDERNPERARVWVSTSLQGELVARTVPGLQEALGVDYRGETVRIVGATADCSVTGFVSTDGGASWERQAPPADMWWLDVDTSSQNVHGPVPQGTLNTVCVPVAISTVDADDGARVACDGNGVLGLRRGSGRVATRDQVDSPAAAAQAAGDLPLALGPQPSCAAALVRPDRAAASTAGGDSGNLVNQVSCLSESAAALGLAASGKLVFAQVGYQVYVSSNEGRSFEPYRADPVAGG